MKHWWVKALVVVTALIVLVSLSFLGLSVRAKNEVERYKDQLRAAGEKLDIEDLIPKLIPAESNSAAAFSIVVERLQRFPHDDLVVTNPLVLVMVAPGKARLQSKEPYWWDRHSSNSWAEVDEAIMSRDSILETLCQLPNPARMDFALDYRLGPELLLSHLAPQKHMAQILSSAAVQSIHSQNNAAAMERLVALLNIIAAVEGEPTMISQLVRYAITSIAIGPTFELIHSDGITDDQLERLQNAWKRLTFIPVLEHVFEMERYSMPRWIADVRTKPERLLKAMDTMGIWSSGGSSTATGGSFWDSCEELADSTRKSFATVVWQSSWSYADERNAIAHAQLGVETSRRIAASRCYLPELDWMQHEMSIRGLTNNPADDSWLRSVLDKEIAGFLEGTLSSLKFFNKALHAEVTREVVLTAIAIKRYQLRNGTLPDSLSDLVPSFLDKPTLDPVDGNPLRYRLNQDGSFVLYSIGNDGVDNGGSLKGLNRTFWWLSGEDWVWPMPASEAEVEAFRNSSFQP